MQALTMMNASRLTPCDAVQNFLLDPSHSPRS